MDTIFALATPRGKSGVAVIRISGPRAHDAAKALGISLPAVRTAATRRLTWNDMVLDEALVLRFDAPASFTGENVIELQVHGATAIVNAVLTALSEQPGLRTAEAGEFTRRALENNRLDLAQVEGLSDLIEAETEAQRRQAMRVFSGALGELAESWRMWLIRAAALLEATIDFADEEVPVDVGPEVKELLAGVRTELARQVDGIGVAERIRDGFEVAIVGPPNSGKSTLLNALAGREAAITSDVAGTTRDVIEVRMDLGGLPVTFLDTAGLRETADKVEGLGIERALKRAEAADLRIILLGHGESSPAFTPGADDIVLRSKSDVDAEGDVSGATGAGLDRLVGRISEALAARATGAGIAMRDRHRIAMQRAIEALGIAEDRLDSAPELAELIAEELRDAVRALDSLVGRVDVEHVLDDIFSSFCIGK
ncbi:tRNA uridine-5-carboxymethylaminomethyl(34) synthesis GTPase MnmE [Alphaproteobacteria bacterium GH1-50]|uniref:tRNA modification GTPase MnmE n=1 Tax=Kangsaoukella pontilimi TaxID=2691042 RepID=A0A7C9IGE0_9RHOB|nr:tRNA uridine-5-carboxymethylaminomethyl(34) synthesis GTPase MnmE [Kangsaoukella pontilimi]MXQ08248.1 tRNA uridine-5-carboxymethylaminomethyl(34) synthesis GTPase MnmE [Kangsaoukella pontilimi]